MLLILAGWVDLCTVGFIPTMHTFEFATLHTQCRLIMPPLMPTYRSEPLESKISESIPFPKIDADVESKEEEEYMSHDSAAKQPVDIGEELQ